MNPTRFSHHTAAVAAAASLLATSAFAQSIPGSAADAGATSALEERANRATADAADTAILGRVDPDTYRVGPGDEFALRYSDLLDPKILRVGPSGELLLPNAGPLPVAGLTVREVETRVREQLRPYIKGKGFVLTLHKPRRFRLPVLGDVERPGVVALQAPVRASEAVEAAGGIAPGGARRGIQIRRDGDTLLVDLVRAMRTGDLATNPLVFETDVIYVPPEGPFVEVRGAVPHQGRYDRMQGDRLTTLLALGGGPRPSASLEHAVLARFRPDGSREDVAVDLNAALAAPGGPADPELSDGDRLFVPERSRWREVASVFVGGEVARPGPYPIEDGVDRLRAVLERAGGTTPKADRMSIRVERRIEEAEPDTAFLRLARELEPMLSPAERSYVVLRTRAREAVSAPVGALLERGDPAGDIALRDGDRVMVPELLPMISVQGEVRTPGFVPMRDKGRYADYIEAAGGYTSRAMKSRTRITLAATGRQVNAGDSDVLLPGDTIWVPAKPERNPWATFRDIIGVAAAAAAIVIAVEAVNN